jgi:hypothetical protein
MLHVRYQMRCDQANIDGFSFLEDGLWFKGQNVPERGGQRRKILKSFQVPDLLSDQLCTDLNGYCGSQTSLQRVKAPPHSSGHEEELETLGTLMHRVGSSAADDACSHLVSSAHQKSTGVRRAKGTRRQRLPVVRDGLLREMERRELLPRSMRRHSAECARGARGSPGGRSDTRARRSVCDDPSSPRRDHKVLR